MEQDRKYKFSIDEFVTEKRSLLEKVYNKLQIENLTENMNSFSEIYNGLTSEIPKSYEIEELETRIKLMSDLSPKLIRNTCKFIGELIKSNSKDSRVSVSYDLTLSELISKFTLSLDVDTQYDKTTSPNLVIESSGKIEKRTLILIQNGPEKVDQAIERSTKKDKSLYSILWTVNTNIIDEVVKSGKITKKELEPYLTEEALSKAEQDSKQIDDAEVVRILTADHRSLSIKDQSFSNTLDIVLNCILTWVTEIELLPQANAKTWALEAEEKIFEGKVDEGIALYDKALDLEPNNVANLRNKGFALAQHGKYAEALPILERVLELSKDDPPVLRMKANVLAKLDRYEDALELYKKLIVLDPKFSPYDSLIKGQTEHKLGRYEEALESYKKSLEANPKNAVAWLAMGDAYKELKHSEDALNAYNKSTELDPKDANAWFAKGNLEFHLRKDEEALKSFDKAIKLNRHLAGAWQKRGSVLEQLERYEEAIRAFDKAIQIDPKDDVSRQKSENLKKRISKPRK